MMSIRPRRVRNAFQELAGELLAAVRFVADRKNDLVGERFKIPVRSSKGVSSNSRTTAKLSVHSFISASNGWIAS
jgi:hypothetical protein